MAFVHEMASWDLICLCCLSPPTFVRLSNRSSVLCNLVRWCCSISAHRINVVKLAVKNGALSHGSVIRRYRLSLLSLRCCVLLCSVVFYSLALFARNFIMLALYWQVLRMKYMLNDTTGRGYTKVRHEMDVMDNKHASRLTTLS